MSSRDCRLLIFKPEAGTLFATDPYKQQTDRQAGRHVGRQAGRKESRQAGMHESWQTGKHTGRHVSRQAGRQVERYEVGRMACRRIDGQADK